MEQRNESPAYWVFWELIKKLEREGIYFKNRRETVSGFTNYSNEPTKYDISTKDKSAYVAVKTFEGLSKRAILMVCKIMQELKLNNALWQFDHRANTKDAGVITELRRKGILIKSGTTDIHIVNPFYIRCGRIGGVIWGMLDLLEGKSAVTTDHIVALPWKEEYRAGKRGLLQRD